MFKLVNQNKKHDFYVDPEGPLFNIVSKGMPCGIGGYTLASVILQRAGYKLSIVQEKLARKIFKIK